jgi:hypothetical protein
MTQFTRPERDSIDAAYRAIHYLAGCTNWSDGPALADALKLERRETGDMTAAKAMVCKAWHEEATNPDKPARAFHWVRPGYLRAFLLGVGHAADRVASDYTGPMVAKALDLCPAAIEANEAHTRRIVEG